VTDTRRSEAVRSTRSDANLHQVCSRPAFGCLATGLAGGFTNTRRTLASFGAGTQGQTERDDCYAWKVRSIAAFTTLIFFSLFTVFKARSDERSAFVSLSSNQWLWGAVLLSLLLQAAVIYIPPDKLPLCPSLP